MKYMDLKCLKKCLDLIPGVKAIMWCRLVGGLYRTVSPNRHINFAVRTYCVLISTYVTFKVFRLILPLSNTDIIFATIQSIQYIGTVVINLIWGGELFMNFLKNIRNIDISLGVKPTYEALFSRILWILVLSLYSSTLVLTCINKLEIALKEPLAILSLMLLQSMVCSSHFTKFMMFELTFYRMRTLRKLIEIDLSTIRRFEGRKIEINNRVRTYKKLLKALLQNEIAMKPLIFLSMGSAIPKVMLLLFYVISGGGSIDKIINFVQVFTESSLPFIPALLAGMINNEVYKIKLIVTKQLLVCREENARDAVEDMVMFLEQRSFRYTIWRLYDVDVPIILTAFKLITTYTVAMIQFSHFYD